MRSSLEQDFISGILTETQQDELLELLEKEDRLENWLDDNVQLHPNTNITYKDKDFLKSIVEPIERFKPDKSIIYQNKKSLYRKNNSLTLLVRVRVAAVLIITLLVSTTLNQTKNHNFNQLEREEIAATANNDINIVKDNSVKTVLTKSNTSSRFSEHYIMSNGLYIDLDNFQRELKSRINEFKKSPVIYNPVLIKESKELVLFAQAQKWEMDEEEYEKEIVINNEEWISSEVAVHSRVNNILSSLKRHLDIGVNRKK